jgi:Transcriptional regulator C-terminal region
MIEHAHENRPLFLALVGKRTGQLVLERFRDLVLDLIRDDLARPPGRGGNKEVAVHFLGGAFLELLSWWLEGKSGLAPTEVERLFLHLATPTLKAMHA